MIRAWCGCAPQDHVRPVARQPPVDRGRRHRDQQRSGLIGQDELAEAAQRGHQLGSTGASRLPVGAPSTAQQNRRPTITSGRSAGPAAHAAPRPSAGAPAPAPCGRDCDASRHRTQLVQDDALVRPARPPARQRRRSQPTPVVDLLRARPGHHRGGASGQHLPRQPVRRRPAVGLRPPELPLLRRPVPLLLPTAMERAARPPRALAAAEAEQRHPSREAESDHHRGGTSG